MREMFLEHFARIQAISEFSTESKKVITPNYKRAETAPCQQTLTTETELKISAHADRVLPPGSVHADPPLGPPST
jgi:hypothetical protein